MCPIHGDKGCQCRYVLESTAFTLAVCLGVVWLVGDRAVRALKGALS